MTSPVTTSSPLREPVALDLGDDAVGEARADLDRAEELALADPHRRPAVFRLARRLRARRGAGPARAAPLATRHAGPGAAGATATTAGPLAAAATTTLGFGRRLGFAGVGGDARGVGAEPQGGVGHGQHVLAPRDLELHVGRKVRDQRQVRVVRRHLDEVRHDVLRHLGLGPHHPHVPVKRAPGKRVDLERDRLALADAPDVGLVDRHPHLQLRQVLGQQEQARRVEAETTVWPMFTRRSMTCPSIGLVIVV
jgi:hypothetical protein